MPISMEEIYPEKRFCEKLNRLPICKTDREKPKDKNKAGSGAL